MKPIVGHLYNTNKGIKICIYDIDYTRSNGYIYCGVIIGGDNDYGDQLMFNNKGYTGRGLVDKFKLVEDLTEFFLTACLMNENGLY